MLTLAWVEHQLEQARNGSNEPQNVRDYALLCIARDNLRAETAKESVSTPPAPVVRLTDHSADLDRVPTLEQIDSAINAAAQTAYTDEAKQHVRDQRTWAQILSAKV